MTELIKRKLGIAIDYSFYRQLIDQYASEGQTSGPAQTEQQVRFTKLNAQRMKRLDKTLKLIPALLSKIKDISTNQIWLVITEAWCGDAAQIVPLFHHIETLTDNITLKLVFRDENPDLMDQFLTKGAKAIPKLIAINAETLEVLGSWGPRPRVAQKMVMDYKAHPLTDYEEFKKELHTWFARDKTLSTQQEILEKLSEWDDM